MPTQQRQVAVIGGGVIGLTTAYRLLEAGYGVVVLARVLTPRTTSDVAAAYWSPTAFETEEPPRRWALDSLTMFQELVEVSESGIDILDFFKLYDQPIDTSKLVGYSPFEALDTQRFSGEWYGYQTQIPRIDVPTYMPWLLAQVEAKGGIVMQRIVQRFGELKEPFSAIVNCSGLGARMLTSDEVYPIRGQVMRVRKPVDFPNQILSVDAAEGTTYVIARREDCLLGGTYQYHNGELEVDPAIATAIMERCSRFYPALAESEILEHKVGLRPGRQTVRLETERLSTGQILVHNYGHGSIGHTLSWGCAAEVVKQIQTAME